MFQVLDVIYIVSISLRWFSFLYAPFLQALGKTFSELEPALSKCKEEGRSYTSLENGTSAGGGRTS